jgi:hypothetical protein
MTDLARHRSNTLVARPAGGVAVRCEALDALLEREGVGTIDLLKMNVEGAEALALAGMPRALARTRHVAIACHDFKAGARAPAMRSLEDVRDALERAGFAVARRHGDPRPAVAQVVYGRNLAL